MNRSSDGVGFGWRGGDDSGLKRDIPQLVVYLSPMYMYNMAYDEYN